MTHNRASASVVAMASTICLAAATVSVHAQPSAKTGTGFGVGPTEVVTNAHVVDGCKEVELVSVTAEC